MQGWATIVIQLHGEIHMVRKWNPISYSWDITKRMVENAKDLKILLYAVERRRFKPKFENWEYIESIGAIQAWFPSVSYTGLGVLISYYMGVEYHICNKWWTELVKRYIRVHNEKQLELVDLYCNTPHLILFTGTTCQDVQSQPVYEVQLDP